MNDPNYLNAVRKRPIENHMRCYRQTAESLTQLITGSAHARLLSQNFDLLSNLTQVRCSTGLTAFSSNMTPDFKQIR